MLRIWSSVRRRKNFPSTASATREKKGTKNKFGKPMIQLFTIRKKKYFLNKG
jgi:hypothetical protein